MTDFFTCVSPCWVIVRCSPSRRASVLRSTFNNLLIPQTIFISNIARLILLDSYIRSINKFSILNDIGVPFVILSRKNLVGRSIIYLLALLCKNRDKRVKDISCCSAKFAFAIEMWISTASIIMISDFVFNFRNHFRIRHTTTIIFPVASSAL